MKGTEIIIGNNEHQKAFFVGLSIFIDLINIELSNKYSPEPIGNHIKVLGGYAFKSSEYKTEGIPIIRISDFQDEKIDLSNVKYYEEKEEYDKYQLVEGDIIIALTGGTIGKLGIVQKELGKLYLNQRVGKFYVLHPKEFYDRYVYWLARGVQEKVKNFGYGGAQPNISGSQIEEILFPIPVKKTQEKIVEFLEDLKENMLQYKEYFSQKTENKIKRLFDCILEIIISENCQKENLDHISGLRQSILSEAVSGKLIPQDKNDEAAEGQIESMIEDKIISYKSIVQIAKSGGNRIPQKPKNIQFWEKNKEIFFHEDITPKNWTNTYFINLCLLQRGFDLPKSQFQKGDYPVTSSGGIMGYHSEFKVKGPGVFTGRSGSVGKVYFIDSNYWPHNTTLFVKDFNGNNPKYVYYALKAYGIERESSSTAVATLNRNRLFKIKIFIPPLEEQVRIVKKIEELMKLCDELEEKVKENKNNSELLMDAVLREAFEV